MVISENIFKEYIIQCSKSYMRVSYINNIDIVTENYQVVNDNIFSNKERKIIKLNWNGVRILSDDGELNVYSATDYFNYMEYLIWQRDYKLNKLANNLGSQYL